MQKSLTNVPAADRSRIQELGASFKLQCERNSRPDIEDFLKLEPRLREPLLHELLMLEFQIRQGQGQAPQSDDYLTRFPEAAAFINQIFTAGASELAERREEERGTAENAEDTVKKKQNEPFLHEEEATRAPDLVNPQDTSSNEPNDSLFNIDETGVFHFDAPSAHGGTMAYTPGTNSPETTMPGHTGESTDLPTIHGYAVTREIARGGMGRVLAAHDLTLDREVAIKVLLPSSSADAAARFVIESKVTARLPHPGVPPVHALGALNGGGPFLAMKLVHGKTLAELLREREITSIDLSHWVGVFEQVCQAVGFAHSQGILHRDLKPANVMIGGFGEVHVMDWGLAKDTDQTENPPSQMHTSERISAPTGSEQGSLPPNMTAAGQVMGTPQYMAPEQARGEVVDTRADVFALGGILSAILTGRAPFTGATTLEVLKKAAAGNVSEALARLDACEADADLIDLARRCLASDPADRPSDGQTVAEVVKAYRAGVEARLQEVQAERAAAEARAVEQRKRRRLWAIAASVVIGVLITGGSTAAWQWLRAEDALMQVNSEQQKTLEALDNLTASRDRNVRNLRLVTKQLVPDLVGRTRKLTESDQSFIRGLLPMWQEIAGARGDGPDAMELRAEGQFSVANLQTSLGQYSEAESAYRAALAAYQDLSRNIPDDPERHQAVARVHNNLGNALVSLGNVPQALDEMRAALAIQQRLTIEYPDEAEYHSDLARSHLNIGNQLGDRGKDVEAEEEFRSASEIFNRLTKDHPEETTNLSDLAAVHANLGNLFHRLGKVQETLDQYGSAVTLYEDLAGRYPTESDYRKKFATIRTNLGAVLFEAGELPKAADQYRQALSVREELASEFPTIAEYRSELIQTNNNFAVLLAAARNPAEAEKYYGRSLELLPGLLEQSPGIPKYRALLASTYDNLGLVLGEQTRGDRRPLEAEKQHRAAIVIWDELQAEFSDNPNYRGQAADCRNHLGLLLSKEGRIKEADELYIQALAVREEMAAKFPDKIEYQRSLAGGYCNLGNLVTARDELADGLKWFTKAVTLLEPRVRSEPKDKMARQFLRNSYWSRAKVKDKLGQTAAATTDWDEAISLSPPREKVILKQFRADSRVRAGLVEEAIENIDAIDSLLKWPPSNRYNFACICAVASEKTDDDEKKKEYSDKAMNLLRAAVRDGWKDAKKIATDPDLDSLRDRDDFRELLDEMQLL